MTEIPEHLRKRVDKRNAELAAAEGEHRAEQDESGRPPTPNWAQMYLQSVEFWQDMCVDLLGEIAQGAGPAKLLEAIISWSDGRDLLDDEDTAALVDKARARVAADEVAQEGSAKLAQLAQLSSPIILHIPKHLVGKVSLLPLDEDGSIGDAPAQPIDHELLTQDDVDRMREAGRAVAKRFVRELTKRLEGLADGG